MLRGDSPSEGDQENESGDDGEDPRRSSLVSGERRVKGSLHCARTVISASEKSTRSTALTHVVDDNPAADREEAPDSEPDQSLAEHAESDRQTAAELARANVDHVGDVGIFCRSKRQERKAG